MQSTRQCGVMFVFINKISGDERDKDPSKGDIQSPFLLHKRPLIDHKTPIVLITIAGAGRLMKTAVCRTEFGYRTTERAAVLASVRFDFQG